MLRIRFYGTSPQLSWGVRQRTPSLADRARLQPKLDDSFRWGQPTELPMNLCSSQDCFAEVVAEPCAPRAR